MLEYFKIWEKGLENKMRKTKYFIMGFIFLLFLNSCGYVQYVYEQAAVAAGGIPSTYTDGNADSYRKDGPRAITNPKYKEKIELLLKDIENRALTEKFSYFDDNENEIILWLPEGIVRGQGKNLLKDRKTGYGIPLTFNTLSECPKSYSLDEFESLKLISNSNSINKKYIYITFYGDDKYIKEIVQKIKEKNGFTHSCKNGKFE